MLGVAEEARINAEQIRALVKLSIKGLAPMFDPAAKLFCYRLKLTGDRMVREGLSSRYTIMTLLGLHKAQRAGWKSEFNSAEILRRLRASCASIGSGGDLGLHLWLFAQLSPDELTSFIGEMMPESAFERYADIRSGRTMELAWFLSGLAHAKLSRQGGLLDFTDLAFKTYQKLSSNQGASGFFGHLDVEGSVVARLRGHIGSFADQVYPIYAMSKFAVAYGIQEPLQAAQKCAEAVCRAQGPMGQWWWHYNAANSEVAGEYPVYAVHQHGMAPLALHALSEASGSDYTKPINSGLAWLFDGANELKAEMISAQYSLAWRCIYQNKLRAYVSRLSKLSNLPTPIGKLNVLYECRPYELGWLLYAFAGHPRSA